MSNPLKSNPSDISAHSEIESDLLEIESVLFVPNAKELKAYRGKVRLCEQISNEVHKALNMPKPLQH